MKLEIATEWYWWRGYPRTKPSSYSFRGLLADTDGPEFYTPAAFPALKPDIDTFGIPRRSRKQRGWHHVRGALPSTSTSTSPARSDERPGDSGRLGGTGVDNWRGRAAATPSDVPPELFDTILAHLTAHRIHGRADKPLLARCALVCRYWAAKCQPVLFEKVALRAREDALQLLAFMRTPGSAVPGLVTGVYVREALQVGGPGVPWLHLVAAIGDRAHRGLSEFSIKLKGPLPLSPGSGPAPGPGSGHDGQQTSTRTPRLRSIHHGLPRTLPTHFSRRIGKLVLLDLPFAALADLAHLVRELPALWRLFCERVTWPAASLPVVLQGAGAALHGHGILHGDLLHGHGHLLHGITRRKPRNVAVYAQSVRMVQCGPRAVEAAVWLVASMRPRGTFVDADDFARVVLLAREMGKGAAAGVGAALHGNHLGAYFAGLVFFFLICRVLNLLLIAIAIVITRWIREQTSSWARSDACACSIPGTPRTTTTTTTTSRTGASTPRPSTCARPLPCLLPLPLSLTPYPPQHPHQHPTGPP